MKKNSGATREVGRGLCGGHFLSSLIFQSTFVLNPDDSTGLELETLSLDCYHDALRFTMSPV